MEICFLLIIGLNVKLNNQFICIFQKKAFETIANKKIVCVSFKKKLLKQQPIIFYKKIESYSFYIVLALMYANQYEQKRKKVCTQLFKS